MMIEPGAIVRVPFPFSNLAVVKKRPVLVLSGPDEHGGFLCMSVTSKGNHAGALAINDADVAMGKLRLASWVRPNKVFTLDTHAVSDGVAVVQPEFLLRVLAALCSVVGGRGG